MEFNVLVAMLSLAKSTGHVLTEARDQSSHETVRALLCHTEMQMGVVVQALMSVSRAERSDCFYQPYSRHVGRALGYFG